MRVCLIHLLITFVLIQRVFSQDNIPPIFSSPQYVFSVSEASIVSTPLTATSPANGIIATDAESDPITFRKRLFTDAPQISIDSLTGVLTVASLLDRETIATYTFDVVADDGQRNGQFLPTVTVQIIVLDVNDNAPVFINTLTSYSIEEGVTNDHQVNPSGQPIKVTDADIGNNQPSTFSIVSGSDGRFTIDPDGNIRTDLDDSVAVNRVFDYETKPSYALTIRATNIINGPSGPVFSEENIRVLIIDINDEDPIFVTGSTDQTISIPESTTGAIFTVEAEDTDHPLIATTFTYSIIFGNDQIGGIDSFAINPTTGVISVAVAELDHEILTEYTLIIQAEEDQTPKAIIITPLTITITDVNESPPVFSQTSYTENISEHSKIGRAVLLVQATDTDATHFILYSLDGTTDSSYFDVDVNTGLVFVRREFDRETQAIFQFEAEAADGLLTATAQIVVNINDVNDNSPTFTVLRQSLDLDEQSSLGAVYDIPAMNPVTDIDEGVNQQVKYTIQNPDPKFTLDPDTGVLSLTAVLDFNTQTVHKLTIVATDQALIVFERRTGSFVLTVNVNDVNGNDPVLAAIGAQTVEEGLPIGSIVFTVSATDLDQGLTLPLSLSITEGAGVPFSITTTGSPTPTSVFAQVSTTSVLDFESTGSTPFNLTIVVSDGNLTDTEIVAVTVLDVNDNSPVFSQPGGYTFTNNENEMGTVVGTADATDPDSVDGPVVYSKSGDNEDNFVVDATSGAITISTSKTLDADLIAVYRFAVIASDQGTPPLSTLATVAVNANDLNDLPPEFVIDNVELSIDENTVYFNIFTFTATDADRTSPNNQFKFFITGSTPVLTDISEFFVIGEDTGVLATNNTANREEFTVITLNIEVSDSLNTNAATIKITINDQNDNGPKFTSPSYTETVFESIPTGDVILQVTAAELIPDENTQITYSLDNAPSASGNPKQFVTIDSTTGMISPSRSLDYETLNTLVLTLTASDGTFSDTATLTITINNVNDNTPTLSTSNCSTTLSEDTALGVFCSLSVSDADQDGTPAFVLEASGFSISPSFSEFGILYATNGDTTVSLVLANALDFEVTKTYSFTIAIVDKGSPTKTADVALTITVTGVNEFEPSFATSSYNFDMDESEEIDYLVGLVTATDQDDVSTPDGVFTYSIPSQPAGFPFKIETSTGAISLKSRVNHEQNSLFQFQVIATDSSVPNPKTGTTTVSIVVANTNENPPVFPSTFSTSISEDTASATSVLSIVATDADRNDVISYSIVSGNSDAAFVINATSGEISTTTFNLDFETTPAYYLLVQASDNGVNAREANTLATITLIDVNDNTPIFDRNPVNSEILEEAINVFVMLVSATDLDSTSNGAISYSVNSVDFNMDSTTGRLTTKVALNREITPSFAIMICASDQGSTVLSVCEPVTVTLLDINDNSPVFDNSSTTSVSLFESAAGAQVVATFTVSDLDLNPTFFFTLADDGGPFTISSSADTATVIISGVSTATPLNREVRASYSLTVTVNDQLRSVIHSFTVQVTDINDETPTFEMDTYILTSDVLEDSADGEVVFTVLAIDNDDSPFNVVTYSLLNSASDRFSINSNTGAISVDKTTGSSIDFEIESSHIITVQASDGTLMSTADVFIPIADINDNFPIFIESSYTIQVSEITAIGTTILAVQANDADSGSNAQLSYEIDSTNQSVLTTFELSRVTGILKTIGTLDADSPPTQYVFNISAFDSTAAPLTSLVLVTITILAENEDTPVFSSPLYTANINEEVASIPAILTVLATELDASTTIEYSIVDASVLTYFSLNPNTGQLSLISAFDREEFEAYTFTIVASDGETPPRQGYSSVQITISDTNDNSPMFLLNEYSVSISESTAINTVIVTVEASDADATPAFNTIQYILVTTTTLFSVDSTTGEVNVVGILDYDGSEKSFSLVINATDTANIDTVIFRIQLTDENDIAPQINNTILVFSFPEATAPGTEIIDIVVLDADTVGTLTFEIVSGNSHNVFNIDSSGRVTLAAGGFDFETTMSYSLVIRVSDGIAFDTATVSVSVTDSNDHTPTFDFPSYSVSLVENDMVGFPLLSFVVTDLDTGDDGAISLSLDSTSNTANMFKITPSTGTSAGSVTGQLLSNISLDRETNGLIIDSTTGAALWILKVIASDNNAVISSRLSSTAEITVSITDANDNFPQFSAGSLSAQVSESSNIGTLVLTLTATDADFGTNADISFQFGSTSQNTDKFSLNADSGELRTTVVLSREDSPSLEVLVEVTDGTNTVPATLTIEVTDINDHNPEFAATSISASILENSAVGTSVTSVTTSDLDDGENGRVTLSIIGGDPDDHFRIVNVTLTQSDIEVALDLIDRETQASYELIILAQDNGTPVRQGTSTVTITVLDANDNAPSFSPTVFTASISESALTASTVTLNTPITVTDDDQGFNSIFSLSLDDNSVFDITSTRNIFLQVALDRESVASYNLVIFAIDTGSPPQTSNVTLVITVEDENDNSPIFSPLSYSATVFENLTMFTLITTVSATDLDAGPNMEISYSLFAGSEGKFEVDRKTGVVTLIRTLDREVTDSYQVIIAAFDSGSPFRSGTATVTITVLDSNDNEPIFSQSLYNSDVDENSVSVLVVDLDASDLDINQNSLLFFAYQDPIAGGSLPFTIDSTSGDITVSGALDRETTDRYTFEVVVRDNAIFEPNRLTSTANVVITINDLNDVAPSFPGITSFRTNIQETTRITTIILSPVATDPDLGLGGEVVYSLSPVSTIFSIDSNTGEIRLIESLDVDSTGLNGESEYTFDLIVTDLGTPPLSSSIGLNISVLDENDNVPIFDSPFFTVGILENATIGTTLIRLTATDNDTNGVINYEIVGGNLYGLFSINETTGDVFTIKSLLSLNITIFELTISAFETGDLTKSSITSLHIEISDTNDNPPAFCQTLDYKFSIAEHSPVATTIGQICGTDKDSGINGDFFFSILSGNDDNAFGIVSASASTAFIVVLNDVLNRESDDMYTLVLIITDRGIPALLSNTLIADIEILDINDRIPYFINLPFSILVNETEFGGFEVFKVLANDLDIDSNAAISFEISSGNIDTVFSIESITGQITTVKPLDFNTVPFYSLVIRATDMGASPLSNTSTLSITLIDANNHAPVFMPPYEVSIQESTPDGNFVILVDATDDDSTTNAELVYSISSGINASHFAIDNTTGSISVNTANLDRETQSLYNLVVTACDMGNISMCTDVGVTITITDANDHAPVFSQSVYSFTILEDRNVLFIVGKVIATDQDEGQNGVIEFFEIVDEPKFSVSLTTGDIILQEQLDRETVSFYQIQILGRDNGAPVLSSNATVNITVIDVNDNPPIIDTTIFTIQISENTTMGTVVFDVDATDIDEGDNSKLTYSILGGHFGDFSIDPNSGALSVNDNLDAEEIIRYDILIQASDSAFPPLTDTDTLVVTIIDINEHPPVFAQTSYLVDLPENSPPGTFLLNVTASDADIPNSKNSEISFFFTSVTDFSVDSVTGTILALSAFDREISNTITLTVRAVNPNSSPVLEGSAQIQITITDVNDQTPYFTNADLTVQISELSQVGFQVLILTADDDDDPNLGNGRVSFSSASANSAEFDRSFRINLDGKLEVNGPLDRESQDTYSAEAVVTDDGVPALFTTTNLTITLSDENDIPPMFSSELYLISFPEDIDPLAQNGVSRLLTTLSYSDGDSTSEYKVSIIGLGANSPFSYPDFNVTSGGDCFLNIGLDRETRDNYTLYVEVINTESGDPRGSFCNPLNTNQARLVGTECKLFGSSIIQLTVTDINDNNPVFVNTQLNLAVSSSASFGSDVVTIQATDADLSDAGEVQYSLASEDNFKIDSTTGVLITNAVFTVRAGEVTSFEVTASDQDTVTSRSTVESFVISIVDNDYLLLIVVDDNVAKTLLCLDALVAKLVEITSFQILIYEVKEHVVGTTVFSDLTGVFFYAIQTIGGVPSLVQQTDLLRKIDDSFSDLSNICEGKILSVSPLAETVNPVLQPPSNNIQMYLIIIFCAVIILCGCLANVLALYQRYIGKRSIKRSDDFVYGGMEGLDVLTGPQRGMVLNQAEIVPEPLPITEELAYESQELKMDLFVDEIPEDEFISGSERTSSAGGGSLLAEILDVSMDDDNYFDDSSISAI